MRSKKTPLLPIEHEDFQWEILKRTRIDGYKTRETRFMSQSEIMEKKRLERELRLESSAGKGDKQDVTRGRVQVNIENFVKDPVDKEEKWKDLDINPWAPRLKLETERRQTRNRETQN